MRRRENWAVKPTPFVQTEAEFLRESTQPTATPRRRAVYSDPTEVSRHWDQSREIEKALHPDKPLDEAKNIDQETRKRPGRPRKDK